MKHHLRILLVGIRGISICQPPPQVVNKEKIPIAIKISMASITNMPPIFIQSYFLRNLFTICIN